MRVPEGSRVVQHADEHGTREVRYVNVSGEQTVEGVLCYGSISVVVNRNIFTKARYDRVT